MNEEIRYILTKEHGRQQDTVELIASENFASEAVMELCGSVFTNKYAEGYPGKRYYNGCENMDLIETTGNRQTMRSYTIVNSQTSSLTQALMQTQQYIKH